MTPQISQPAPDFGGPLVQFEAEWCNGQIPDVANYLRRAENDDRQFIEDLIEVDLECRWKQFDADSDPAARDRYGFPRFPLIDDYAAVLPQALQHLIFTPRCIAEEYRARSRWGDKPSKQSLLERFPSDRTHIEAALNAIDTDFEKEGINAAEQSSVSVSAAAQGTVILGQSARKDSTLVPESELIGTEIGKYRLESRLGHGAFGEVWKAHDPALKRHVAIKFPRRDKHFPEELLETFRTEAQKLAVLDHIPLGIVDVYDCGEHGGRPYFVSKFIDGESLADRLQREKLSHEESAELVARVAETLKRAHKEKLVHRDIKPANILLDKEGQPYLADFGMAATEEEQLSEGGGILGTIAYMAPEQARGESHRVDGRADIYALGVILYRLLTGELPYGGQTTEQYLDNIQHQKPRPPRQIDETIPSELERICLKCLKKDEDERYSSAGEVARELRCCDSHGKHIKYAITAAAILFMLLGIGLLSSNGFTGWFSPGDSTTPGEDAERQPAPKTVEGEVAASPAPRRTDPHDLLAQPMNEIIFDHESSANNWNPDDKTGELKLRSYNDAMISFGSLDISELSINALIEPVEQKPSEFGFFWGLHEVKSLNDGRIYRAKCLIIGNGLQFVGDQLRIATIELIPDGETGFRISKVEAPQFEKELDLGFPPIWRLRLHFHEAQLISININGQQCELAESISQEEEDYSDGLIGIFAYTADFVVKRLFWERNLGERKTK